MAGIIFWFAYSKGWIFANFDSIDAKQAIEMIEKDDDNITLLDVRTIGEFRTGHIKDARLIPVQELTENINMLEGDKHKKILIYCRSGSRSVVASRILKDRGFTPINIKGGIISLMGAKAELTK